MRETQTTDRFHPRVTHSLPYYLRLILMLVQGLAAKQTDREVAQLLNANAVLSPSGKPWTTTAVSAALFKLRNFRTHPNRIHSAMLQLIFDGYLKASQVGILFEPRPKHVL